MDISHEESLMLVTQVQKAHRLAAGFYQRMLPAFESLAQSLDTSFWYWQSNLFSRPAGRYTYPGKQWSWDLLPMSAPLFVFLRQDGPHMQISDLVLEFQLQLDPALTQASKKGQPDPVVMVNSEPLLLVYLYWPTEEAKEDLKTEWEAAIYPVGTAGQMEVVSPKLKAVRLEFPLSEFVQNAGAIETTIRSHLQLK
ncbi:hypothetical protein [Pseudomonas sp. PS01297]|uniref:hypothetical protein n=1 Tax=Pseudomonas sp. PS01297 TaxID=2991433 RepID=UPI00249C9412|nr:hypothetical protein [Pseudomonas sp. PS01297]